MTPRRAVLLAVLGLSIVLLAAVLMWEPGPRRPAGPNTGLKVIVLAVDGLDWFLLGEYAEAGRLPHINRILRSAVTGEIEADRPVVPHVGWTLVARGAPLEERESDMVGMEGAPRLFGVVPELARLVNEQGGEAVAIGWPAAWPVAEGEPGIVAPYTPEAGFHAVSLAPALFEAAPGQAGEIGLADEIDAAVRRNLETVRQEFADDVHEGSCGDQSTDEALNGVRWGYLADRITLDVAGPVIAEREPDLSMVYLGGLDTAGHRFLAAAMPDYFEDLELEPGGCEDVVPDYYSFIDNATARLLRLADDGTIFILMSAYGMHPSVDSPPATGGHGLGPPGVLLVRGPHLVGRGGESISATTTDLAPTVLAALGLSIPEGMTGRVVPEMLPKGVLEERPPSFAEGAWSPATSVDAPPECSRMEMRKDERLSTLA
ncbi:MAG: hypothetical protein GF400_09235, partial [Candidatus Eisenbacteria bacterium]|nr:hypothetical protein [Candidatus Eisenbacteria bacterium]